MGSAKAGLAQTPKPLSLPIAAGGISLCCPIVWTSKPRPQAAGLDAP